MMNNRIKIIIIAVITCSIFLSTQIYMKIFDSEEKVDASQEDLWSKEPKVVLRYIRLLNWWLKGHDRGMSNGTWEKSTQALNDVIYSNSSEIVADNFCILFVNDYNNTICVVLKSLDPEIKQEFLDIMAPKPGVTVIFKKGPATWWELEKWEKAICSELYVLRDRGVLITAVGKTTNATMMMEIKDIDMEKVGIVLEVLEEKVPPGILVLSRGEIAELD